MTIMTLGATEVSLDVALSGIAGFAITLSVPASIFPGAALRSTSKLKLELTLCEIVKRD